MRILIAEDNIAMANVIAFNLGKAGFDVLHVASGDTAWKLLQQEEFALLVTDFQMPGMSGGDLTRRMRQEPSLSAIPVIMLTAKCLEIDVEQYREELGVSAVMAKPFSPRSLVQMVEKLLLVAPAEGNSNKRYCNGHEHQSHGN